MPSPASNRRNAQLRRTLRGGHSARTLSETLAIRGIIAAWLRQPKPKPTQVQLAGQLGVDQSYLSRESQRLFRRALAGEQLPTAEFGDLEAARRGREQVAFEAGYAAPSRTLEPLRRPSKAWGPTQPGTLDHQSARRVSSTWRAQVARVAWRDPFFD